MAIKTTCSHVLNSDNTITLNFTIESDYNISTIHLEYTGYSASSQPINELKDFSNIGNKYWNYSWTLNPSVVPWIQGTYEISATNASSQTHTKKNNWLEKTEGSTFNIWGAANNFGDNIVLWGYANANAEFPIYNAKFEWRGYDSAGKNITGEKTLPIVFLTNPSLSVDTNCSSKYAGSATVTMYNGMISKSEVITWHPQSENQKSDGLTVTSVYVDNNATTGMQNGKYVVGTKLLLTAKVKK